jgi:hypothetical protein
MATLTPLAKVTMGRTYAGVLGSLAMAVAIGRGLLESGGVLETLNFAILSLAAFAVLGATLGHLAQNTVDDSVHNKLQQQLTQHAARNGLSESS